MIYSTRLRFTKNALLLIGALLLGANKESFAESRISAESEVPVLMGAGYDPAYGRVGDKCIGAPSPTASGTDGAKEISYKTYLVENTNEFEQTLGLSASASYGVMFSGKADFAKSVNINSYSVYVLVEVQVKTQSDTISDIAITEKALTLLKTDPSRFRTVCGTEFVVSMTKGGQLFGVIEISTNSRTEQSDLKASINGGGAVFKASAELSQRLKEITKNKNTKVILWASGTKGEKLPSNVEGMLQFAADFPSQAIQHPTSFAAITRDYTGVLNWPSVSLPDQENRAAILATLSNSRIEHMKARNDAEFVINNPQQFKPFNKDALELKRKEILKALDNISIAARGCLKSVEECKFESIPLLDISLPARLDGLIKVCHIERSSVCGVESNKVAQSAWCGYTNNTGTGLPCGAKLYQLAKGKACGFTPSPVYGLYTWPHRMTSAAIKTSTCISKGHDLSTGRIGCHGEPGGGPGTCNGANQPNNNEFIQCADYNTCRDISFGVEQYHSCQNEAFGKTANTCEHERHGAAVFKLCSVNNAEPHERCD